MTSGPEMLTSVAFGPDGASLAVAGEDHLVHRWDTATQQPLGEPMAGHTATVRALAFLPDGRLVSGADDMSIRIWNPRATSPIIRAEVPLTALAISPDGEQLVTGAGDGIVARWDAEGNRVGPALTGHTKEVGELSFSPDGHRIAAAGFDGSFRIWDVADGAVQTLPPRPGKPLWAAVFSPGGDLIAAAGAAGFIEIWDVRDAPKRLHAFPAHPSTVTALAFSPDGGLLASTGFDGSVRLWDAETAEPVGEPLVGLFTQENSLAVGFSPDGRTVVGAGMNGVVQTWDVDSAEPGPVFGRTGLIWSVAFSPDGELLASGGADGTVRVWDVSTATALMDPLVGHRGRVTTVAFTPNGGALLSASDDGTVRSWPMTAAPRALCDKLTMNMSREQWDEWVSPDISYLPGCPGLPIG